MINRVRHSSVRRRAAAARRDRRGQGLVEFALIVPLMFILAIAVGDFGRLFTAAVAVESAAREAADYGAFLGNDRWDEADLATMATNEAEMRRRACTSASELTDYVGNPGPDDTGDCTSPVVTIHAPIHPSAGPAAGGGSCSSAGALDKPCWIHVTVSYEFRPLIPFPPIPSSIMITRDSWFAISDLSGS